jgi:oxygen-independent coproporphyrinogen-3 oxidase
MLNSKVIPLHPAASSSALVVDTRLIGKYDRPGPRYTSYPTADRFVEAYGTDKHRATLASRGLSGPVTALSLYVHLPFCDTVCFYCGCNKVVTRDRSKAAKYLRYLDREAALTACAMRGSRRVEQLHLGGGTPTFLSSDELRELMRILSTWFELSPGEYAIEIDPRSVDAEKIATLASLGFNRMSLGIQDFDPAVQKAVNRIQGEEITRTAIDTAREGGFTSVNVDLIYGLPRQTVDGFGNTLDKVIALKPDRIALYSYAHLPTMFKPQRRILDAELPTAQNKLGILSAAIRQLGGAGYEYVGMDHFALAHDELAIAARQGRLHRNFQGYSTRPDCDLVALGVSAISKIGATYSQNLKTLDDYYDALDNNRLPVMRGVELSSDDLLRRSVIQALMCHFELDIESVEIAHLIDFQSYFATELEQLAVLDREGLVKVTPGAIVVTAKGRMLVRVIATVFDRYLNRDAIRERFSKLI